MIDRITGKSNLLDFFGILGEREGGKLEKNIREARTRHRRMHVKKLEKLRK